MTVYWVFTATPDTSTFFDLRSPIKIECVNADTARMRWAFYSENHYHCSPIEKIERKGELAEKEADNARS